MAVTLQAKRFAKDLGLALAVPGRGSFTVNISDITRPGLQFAGYFDNFVSDRIQLVGNAEMALLTSVAENVAKERMDLYFSYKPPAVVIARGHPGPPAMENAAKKAGVPVFLSPENTTKCLHNIAAYLEELLAPSEMIHAVFVDVSGVGILLTGESGIGKSETALELIKRGHILVADDVVELRRVNDNMVFGTAPELVRHLMELRGIGIIDIRMMHGVGAVKNRARVELIIEFEEWADYKQYDRLGLDQKYRELLGVDIPYLEVPVRPGRNLASIVEVAARNFRLKAMGYNAAKELERRQREQQEMEADV